MTTATGRLQLKDSTNREHKETRRTRTQQHTFPEATDVKTTPDMARRAHDAASSSRPRRHFSSARRGVRSDKRQRQIAFGIDTAACRTVVPARHPATRGYRCHWDTEARVQYSTAGKSVVRDEGRRSLVSKVTEGKLMTVESRQAEVRRPLMAVKPLTQQGQWAFFRPDRAFAYKIDSGRVGTPNGRNLTTGLSFGMRAT